MHLADVIELILLYSKHSKLTVDESVNTEESFLSDSDHEPTDNIEEMDTIPFDDLLTKGSQKEEHLSDHD